MAAPHNEAQRPSEVAVRANTRFAHTAGSQLSTDFYEDNLTVMTTPIDTTTYEALFARMQQIVAALEAGELPLEQALALYEEGVSVAAACQHLLDNAVLRVQELQSGVLPRPGLLEE